MSAYTFSKHLRKRCFKIKIRVQEHGSIEALQKEDKFTQLHFQFKLNTKILIWYCFINVDIWTNSVRSAAVRCNVQVMKNFKMTPTICISFWQTTPES
jgi:hypothetical protein